MDFIEFKKTYQKENVIEFPNRSSELKPLVTIKLVTYNHAKFIKQCLDSLLIQKTNFDYQILIAEDDSIDGTREICIDYAKRHPKIIRLLLNSRSNNILVNGKPSGFFNSTYANFCITSKYISIIEGDDYWTDINSLQKRFDFLENNDDFVMCFHGIRYFNEYLGRFEKNDYLPFQESTTVEPLKMISTSMPTSSILFRNNLIDLYEKGMEKITCGDVVLRGKLCQHGKAKYLNDVTPSVYRKHQGGIHSTLSNNEKYNQIIKARKYLIDYYKRKQWHPEPIHFSLSQNYMSQFVSGVKEKSSLNLNLLLKSYKHTRNCDRSFIKLLSSQLVRPLLNKLNKKPKLNA